MKEYIKSSLLIVILLFNSPTIIAEPDNFGKLPTLTDTIDYGSSIISSIATLFITTLGVETLTHYHSKYKADRAKQQCINNLPRADIAELQNKSYLQNTQSNVNVNISNPWVFLSGPSGSGKTALAQKVAHDNGHSYHSISEDDIKKFQRANPKQSKQETIEEMVARITSQIPETTIHLKDSNLQDQIDVQKLHKKHPKALFVVSTNPASDINAHNPSAPRFVTVHTSVSSTEEVTREVTHKKYQTPMRTTDLPNNTQKTRYLQSTCASYIEQLGTEHARQQTAGYNNQHMTNQALTQQWAVTQAMHETARKKHEEQKHLSAVTKILYPWLWTEYYTPTIRFNPTTPATPLEQKTFLESTNHSSFHDLNQITKSCFNKKAKELKAVIDGPRISTLGLTPNKYLPGFLFHAAKKYEDKAQQIRLSAGAITPQDLSISAQEFQDSKKEVFKRSKTELLKPSKMSATLHTFTDSANTLGGDTIKKPKKGYHPLEVSFTELETKRKAFNSWKNSKNENLMPCTANNEQATALSNKYKKIRLNDLAKLPYSEYLKKHNNTEYNNRVQSGQIVETSLSNQPFYV